MSIALIPRTDDLDFEFGGLRYRRLTESRWRITQLSGPVVGYLEHEPECDWRLSRMTADRRRFVQLGSFDSFEEAARALKWM